MSPDAPAPYLASHFYPARPELKCPPALSDELRSVQAEIQCERYAEAAGRLQRHGDDPYLVVAAAECFLLADDPAAAQSLLARHLPPNGHWALACAQVHQHDLEGALASLESLDRFGLMQEDQRTAYALLIAHVRQARRGNGLSDPGMRSPEQLALAREEGYRRFVDRQVRAIERTHDAPTVERIVERVEAGCAGLSETDARRVLLPVYEAAVRASSDCRIASRALDRVLREPELLGGDDAAHSRALLFGTASGRLDELHDVLRQLASAPAERDVSHARWLAVAKLALVRDDLALLAEAAARAQEVGAATGDHEPAVGLQLAHLWLTPDDAPYFSQWVVRSLHPYLPAAVAERLEERTGRFLDELGERARGTVAGREAAARARQHLAAAAEIARTSGDGRSLRAAIGRWAHHTAIAMLEAGWERLVEPAAHAEAARLLLGPKPPDEVVVTLARALGYAYARSPERGKVRDSLDEVIGPGEEGTASGSPSVQQVLAEWERWRSEGGAAPGELAENVAASLQPVADEPVAPRLLVPAWLADLKAPVEVRELIETCFAHRAALLPETAPFRGRRWFRSDVAHRHYQAGRTAKDPYESYKAFDAAWTHEPNGIATTQGLIHGLRKRVREQEGRMHALERRAQILDQRVGREVEAALAWQTLATFVERESPEWRARMGRAAAALRRGTYGRPWTLARNAEIAIELEVRDPSAAAEAAWTEASLSLPGTEASRRYALLAASLWGWSHSQGHVEDARMREARERATWPRLTNREAVRYAVNTGWLGTLASLQLDEASLEELWRECQGNEEWLRHNLERQANDRINPRREYLSFLDRKLAASEPAGLALDGTRAVVPMQLTELRLATAELVVRDVVRELATPSAYLLHVNVRRFLAALRYSTAEDRTAYDRFASRVEDALAALFDLRHATPEAQVEPYGGRLARARGALYDVVDGGQGFANIDIRRCAVVMGRYLQTGLDEPTTRDYIREKHMHLVPSRLGQRLGAWYSRLRQVSGSQDFFHQHQHYRYNWADEPADWLNYHRVQGSTAGQAIRTMLDSLDVHAKHLAEIEAEYRRRRTTPGAGLDDFLLAPALRDGSAVLRRAISPEATRGDLGDIADALKTMSDSLRRLDMTRLAATDGLLTQHSLPEGQYLIPRGPELLSHWRDNVGDHPTLRGNFEVRDDANRAVLCSICLDQEPTPAPDWVALRGLAQFADVVEALGGQLHLWMARPDQHARCRVDGHRGCAADDYVRRIDQRLRELAANQWLSQRGTVEKWLTTLRQAQHGQQSATLAFVVLPRLHESGA